MRENDGRERKEPTQDNLELKTKSEFNGVEMKSVFSLVQFYQNSLINEIKPIKDHRSVN